MKKFLKKFFKKINKIRDRRLDSRVRIIWDSVAQNARDYESVLTSVNLDLQMYKREQSEFFNELRAKVNNLEDAINGLQEDREATYNMLQAIRVVASTDREKIRESVTKRLSKLRMRVAKLEESRRN